MIEEVNPDSTKDSIKLENPCDTSFIKKEENEFINETDVPLAVSDNNVIDNKLQLSAIKKPNSPTKSSPKKSSGSKHNYKKVSVKKENKMCIRNDNEDESLEDGSLAPKIQHFERSPKVLLCQATQMPNFLMQLSANAHCTHRELYCHDRSAAWSQVDHQMCHTLEGYNTVYFGSEELSEFWKTRRKRFTHTDEGGILAVNPTLGWNHINIPGKIKYLTLMFTEHCFNFLIRQ